MEVPIKLHERHKITRARTHTHTHSQVMLGQGCLKALLGEQSISTERGFKMGFCQWPEMGSKVIFCVQKRVEMDQNPLFYPLWTQFGTLTKTDVHQNPMLGPETSGSAKGVFWIRGLFRKVHLLEILENFKDSREPPECGKQRRIRPCSRDSREFRDSRGSRGSRELSIEKTPFVMTPFLWSRKKVTWVISSTRLHKSKPLF